MCEFCKDNEFDQTWDEGGAHDFRISQNCLFYYDEQFGWEGMQINFCPVCGRFVKKGR